MASTRAVFVALLGIGIAGCPGGGNPAPTIVNFTCTSPLPFGGGPVTLSWNVNGAVSLSIDNNVGVVNPPTSGSTSVNVTASTTFTLTATGSTGSGDKATMQCLVVVNTLKINSFTAMPSPLPVGGGTVTLAWDVKDATSLSIDQGVGPVTPVDVGNKTVPVTKTTVFTLTAKNAIGKATMTASVVVPQTAPVINSFTATPNVLGVGGGTVTLAWDVIGATALLIDQGVGPVTPADAGDRTVLVGASTVFILTASNGIGVSQADAGVTVALPGVDGGTTTIRGLVVDNNGIPVPGETVLIASDGGTQTALTDGDGGFVVSGVYTPYDATVVESAQAVQYQGLNRSDPYLTAFRYLPANRSATITGQFTGGSFPEVAGYSTVFIFSSPEITHNMHDQPSGSYSEKVTWAGPATTAGALYALQVHSVAGRPVDYPGYGTLSGVVLQDTGTFSGENVSLSPVTTGVLSGTVVSVPSGYSIYSKAMSLAPASGLNFNLVNDRSPAAAFSFVSPSISGTDMTVFAAATSTLGEFSYVQLTGQPANSTVSVTIPAAPSLTAPPNAATGVTVTSSFVWTAYPNGVHEFVAFPQSGPGPTFYVLTAATTLNLADAGLPLPASTPYSWEVIGLAQVSAVDVLVQPGGIDNLTIDLNEGFSVTNSFTTGP